MRFKKWLTLPLILCLTIGPTPAGLAESAVDGPILESVESIPEAVEIDLNVETDTINENIEEVSEPEAGHCYARLSASAPLYASPEDAFPAFEAGGGVALLLERANGRAKIAFVAEGGVMELWADESQLSALSSDEVNAWMDALAASGTVALYRGDLDCPLGPVALAEAARGEEPVAEEAATEAAETSTEGEPSIAEEPAAEEPVAEEEAVPEEDSSIEEEPASEVENVPEEEPVSRSGETVDSGEANEPALAGTEVVIDRHPQSVLIQEGSAAEFSVSATGEGLTYRWQWRAGGVGGWSETALKGYDTAKLSFTALAGFNGRQYRCVIANAYGRVAYSNAAQLTVASGLAITAQPAACVVGAGETARFQVTAQGANVSYQWQWRANASGSWTDTTLNGYDTATLSFAASGAFNGRQYRCFVRDGFGNTAYTSEASLEVRNYAAITAQPKAVAVGAGQTARFTVGASGDGIGYQWQWRANASAGWANTTLNGHDSAALSFAASNAFNGRQYRCVITDRYGHTAASATAALEVRNYAAITQQPSQEQVAANAVARFTVKATGDGIGYQWQWRANASGSWANTGLSGCNTARLSVVAQPAFDGRQYRCVITDRYGTSVYSSAATLTVYNTDGWVSVNNLWYYYRNGVLVTGWVSSGGKWYYLADDGHMLTGWQKVDGSWYYLKPSGEMAKGWLQQGDDWYYLSGSGAMVTGWQQIGGTWYYFTRSGKMISESSKITLSLNQTKLKLGKDEVSRALKARYDSDVEEGDIVTGLTWTSSKTSVVKVNAATGEMTALDTGSATITATTANGLTASCAVTVVKAPSKVTISPATAKLQVGESSQYTATLPSGTAGGVTWSSSDPSVAIIDENGVVSGLTVGSAVITVTTYNGKTSTSNLLVKAPDGTLTEGEAVISTTSTYREDMTDAEKIEYVIYVAQTKLGKPYVYGSFGPNSFDCSGFTTYCYRQINVELKHSAYTQGYDSSQQKIEDPAKLKRGDIVCFDTVSDSDLCDHTGIYLGNGKFIHASSSAKKVIVSTLAQGYYQRAFVWGRRVM